MLETQMTRPGKVRIKVFREKKSGRWTVRVYLDRMCIFVMTDEKKETVVNEAKHFCEFHRLSAPFVKARKAPRMRQDATKRRVS